MTNFANWVSLDVMRTLGWTLLHFIWQGAALAALFAAAVAACRSAAARYALATATLVLMMAAPAITFTWLYREANPAVRSGAQGALPWVGSAAQHAAAPSGAPAAEVRSEQPTAMLWLVELWFLGVLVLSLRTAGGLFLIERMRRKEIQPVGRELYLRCIALQLRMGVERAVRYCGCQKLDAPAVLGWFRPVVLLPARALLGLSEEQMEAVIAHELAHIRRLDCFVNLFQIAAETADGACVDVGGKSQPAGGTRVATAGVEWSYGEDAHGGIGSEFCLPGRRTAGRKCVSGGGAGFTGE
jgi:beta-lactamase regulating signal transducer with metallopeptidase domain